MVLPKMQQVYVQMPLQETGEIIMTDAARIVAARQLKSLVEKGVSRKAAFIAVIKTLHEAHLPGSRRSIYAWCEKFGINIR